MKKITASLVGAGSRGTDAYASYAIDHPNEIQFVAVAEPNIERRERFKKLHNIPNDMCFESWEDLLNQPRLSDAVLICTQDRMHFQPTLKALEKNYHILLEKPMSIDAKECIILGEESQKHDVVFSICHVLRYTKFFSEIKKLLDDGRIGKLISIQHNENVGFFHQAHSFVRGHWRNSEESCPMILAKCCHDMDIISWLVGSECVDISSFGDLTLFKQESAPELAPKRCLDGCAIESECPYSAIRIYLGEKTEWPVSEISFDKSLEARTKAIEKGPYGRCVYYCDNNVVDHQVVNMKFKNDVTVAFTMCAFTNEVTRTIKLMGSKGEIRGAMEKNEIEITDFITGNKILLLTEQSASGHSGGDEAIMRDFVSLVRNSNTSEGLTSAKMSVQAHIMALAAEKSRLENRVININKFMNEFK